MNLFFKVIVDEDVVTKKKHPVYVHNNTSVEDDEDSGFEDEQAQATNN